MLFSISVVIFIVIFIVIVLGVNRFLEWIGLVSTVEVNISSNHLFSSLFIIPACDL